MKSQDEIDYYRIAEAITFIQQHFKKQPALDKIAENVHLSPYHFQRLFTKWAGVSPKKFLQYISVEHAKKLLRESQSTILDTAYKTGLSGTGRLHDLFVNIEGMTPGEYKNKGSNLNINYSYANSIFGKILVASTHKGICYMGFSDDDTTAFSQLKQRYPNAYYTQKTDRLQQEALEISQYNNDQIHHIKLHLKGTDFQLKVWEALLNIPMGHVTTYGTIAKQINNPNASRAVGTAIGNNPVALIIPCHRVIQSSGLFGGYMWGTTRKTAIIGFENVKKSELTHVKK